jgi:hypothetical protein
MTLQLGASAASTERIILTTAVDVLSTDEPIRVYQQLSTAAAIAPGRIEVVAGRGSSSVTFPLFDYDEADYDMLYRSKLDLLLELDRREEVTWSGPHRRRRGSGPAPPEEPGSDRHGDRKATTPVAVPPAEVPTPTTTVPPEMATPLQQGPGRASRVISAPVVALRTSTVGLKI